MTPRPTADTDPVSASAAGRSWWRRPLSLTLRYGVPLIVTLGLCRLLLRDIDPSRMLATVSRDCDYRWLLIDVACLIGAMIARAARWQIQLKALRVKASIWMLTLSVFGTYAVNLVFPRLGEVWRTGFVAARCRASFTTVFGSMVADRLTDTVCVGLITLLAFALSGPRLMEFLASNPSAGQKVAAWLASPWVWIALIALAGAIVWLFTIRHQSRILTGVIKVVRGLWDGFAVIVRMPGKGLWLLYTILLWNCYFWGLWAIFESFPLTAEVIRIHGLTALTVCFVLTSLSMLVPSNGGIGPWQWAMIFALGFYNADIPGLDRTYMTTFANLALGVQTLFSILLGLLTFVWIAFTRPSDSSPQSR